MNAEERKAAKAAQEAAKAAQAAAAAAATANAGTGASIWGLAPSGKSYGKPSSVGMLSISKEKIGQIDHMTLAGQAKLNAWAKTAVRRPAVDKETGTPILEKETGLQYIWLDPVRAWSFNKDLIGKTEKTVLAGGEQQPTSFDDIDEEEVEVTF